MKWFVGTTVVAMIGIIAYQRRLIMCLKDNVEWLETVA